MMHRLWWLPVNLQRDYLLLLKVACTREFRWVQLIAACDFVSPFLIGILSQTHDVRRLRILSSITDYYNWCRGQRIFPFSKP